MVHVGPIEVLRVPHVPEQVDVHAQRVGLPFRDGGRLRAAAFSAQRIRRAYRLCMTVLVRLLQLLLAVFALLTAAQFVMTLGSDIVGPVEQVALLVVAAACLWGCVALQRLAARKRATHHLP